MTSAVTAGGALGAPRAGLAKPRKAGRRSLVGWLFLAPAFYQPPRETPLHPVVG